MGVGTVVTLQSPDGVLYSAGATVGGATSALQTTANTKLDSLIAALAVTNANTALPTSSTAITTSTTTLVKSGAGRLHSITVTSLGTIASAVTVYNALTATGTPIATINSLSLFGQFVFDIPFTTGLTIVTTGTVAPIITVSYS